MPRINRIRVTNIQYDNGKKHLPDLLFEAKGLDTLFILANGGGKSLLVQLILQVILPNTRMGKRKLEDLLLAGNYTGHVAVEWLLDSYGERRQFLCTGFCYSSGQSGDRALRYYNYLFSYDDRSELSIETLPLIYSEEKDGPKRPIQYQRLKDWLRDKGIQPIDKPETYQDRLKAYGILPEEWKNIRDTNGSEGGVDKFFEKSRTTLQLMDNLLIPAVEEMIFQDEQKKQELFHAFAQYREMLLEIPVIRQNLQDFALIRDAAQGVVEEVEALDRLEKDFAAKTKEIVRLARSFYEFNKEAQKALEKLGQEKENASREYDELDWQEQSHEWFLKQLELKEAGSAEHSAGIEYTRALELLRKAEEDEKGLCALYYFSEGEKAAQEEFRYRRELELMEQAEPELKSLLVERKQVLKAAWEEHKKELEKQLKDKEQELDALKKERKVLTEAKTEAKLEQRNLTMEISDIKNWLEGYKKNRQDLLEYGEIDDVLNPEEGLKRRRDTLRLWEEREAEAAIRRGQLAAEMEEAGEEILSLHREKSQIEAEGESIKERLARFQREANALQGALSALGIYIKSLLAEKEEALLRVKKMLTNVQEKKLGLQAELANLQEKWALVEGRDYYVPHHDLLKIKNRLERAGVYTVLGSEWLAGQPLSEGEKEEVLKRQPLLPFAVLIEANQVNTVKHIVRQGKEWTCDVPLLFLVKSAHSLGGDGAGDDFFPLWQDELYLFRPDTFAVYTSATVFQGLKSRLLEKIKAKEQEVKEAFEREGLLISLQGRLIDFYQQYPAEQVRDWEKKGEELKDYGASLAQRIKGEEARRERLKGELNSLEKIFDEIALEKQKLKEIIGKIEAFLTLHLLYPGKEAEKKEREEKLKEIDTRLEEIEQRLTGISVEDYAKKGEINEINRLIKAHEEDFLRYGLREIAGSLESSVSYDHARIEVEVILKQLDEKQGERAHLQILLEKAVKQRKLAMSEVEKTGVKIEWLRQNLRPINREEMEEAKGATKESKGWCDAKKEEFIKAQGNVQTARKLLEHIAGKIRRDFNREPYHSFTEAAHELEIENIRRNKEKLKKLMKEISFKIAETEEWRKETQEAYETVLEKMPEESKYMWSEVSPYTYEKWAALEVKPRRLLAKYEKERADRAKEIEKQKNIVRQQFEQYLHKLETTNNVKIRQFIRDVRAIMAENRLYDYGFVQNQFLRIFEGLDRYETQYNNTLAECEKNKGHLVDLCLRRVGSVYDSVMEIPKNSRVRIYERDVQVIRLDWPRRDDKEAWERVNYYIEQALSDLQVYKQQGKNDDEINSIMETKLRTRNLLEQIAPLENCRVTVYKPRKESMIRNDKLEYAPWDEVPKWSGGEEYSVYVTMFMIVLTHIRQQTEGRRNVWKVLLADNPFGKASSPHVWEPVFQIAKANRIQLMCLTAHKQEDILKRFPVVYSLQLRSAYGKEIMRAELMESGFYRLDTALGDGAQMMLPF
jgi:hypothetical protein